MMASVKLIHDATACIYKYGIDKPLSKWSFQFKLLENKESKDELINRLKLSSGIKERTRELGIQDFKVKLQYKRTISEPEFPKGRIFSIDSQDQLDLTLPLLQANHELIVKVVEVQCATVSNALSGKRKHNNDIDEAVPITPPMKNRAKTGRPNTGKKENDRSLWDALKVGLDCQRSLHQQKKFDKFKKDVEEKYPGVVVENERLLKCVCGTNVVLNKLRSLINYVKHCNSCISKQLAEKDVKEMSQSLKRYLSSSRSNNSTASAPVETTDVTADIDSQSVTSNDSLASCGAEFQENTVLDDGDFEDGGVDIEETLSDDVCNEFINVESMQPHLSESNVSSAERSTSSSSSSLEESDNSRDSDGFLETPLCDDLRLGYGRSKYWDPVCEKLQNVLDDGILKKDSIFYIYLKNALTFVTDIDKPELCFQWDKEVLDFVESLEYHGHEKTINLLRGPGFLGSGRGGTKSFDWSSWNWPLPGKTTRKKSCTGYSTDNGIYKNLLQSFLELADEKQSGIVPLIDNETVKVIPIALKKDGMAIKPGMTVDSRQGLIVGTTEKIDHKYIEKNPNPDPEHLKNIFVKEAECYCATTLDRKISLPIGVDYISGSLNAEDTCEAIENKTIISQMCLGHIKSSNCRNGVLHAEKCSSMCNDCLEGGTVCTACFEMGHKYIEPALRACDLCISMNRKCVKAATIVFLMDSESRNGGAQSLFASNKSDDQIDPNIRLCEILPDPVHVGKRISRQFSNWYLVVDGYRINRVQLRTLRNDQSICDKLRDHLSIAACRNRDRMDVDSMLEISSTAVRNVIKENVEVITDTIVPEKFKVYEGNKRGVIAKPTAVCEGPFGSIYIADAEKGNIFSARLHYPVDVNEICGSLSQPMSISYKDGVIFIAEYGAGRLSCVDLDYSMIYNPRKMTVKQLKRALTKLKILPKEKQNLRKDELQRILTSWMESKNADASKLSNSLSATPIKVLQSPSSALKRPSALALDNKDQLFVTDDLSNSIFLMSIKTNGITITASILRNIHCPRLTFSIVPTDNCIYISSSDPVSGGILRLTFNEEHMNNEHCYLVKNGSAECGKAHGLAVLSVDTESKRLVFTDVSARRVKCLTIKNNSTSVEIISGTGFEGQSDGARATFCQPTSCCIEMNTIFVCDTATGSIRMITSPNGLLKYLEMLHMFLRVFGVHRRSEPRRQVHKYSANDAIEILQRVYAFFKKCDSDVRTYLSNPNRVLQGPEGVCSSQTMRDLELTVKTIQRIATSCKDISADYLDRALDLSSLTTLVVENVFAEMREGNDVPLLSQFAYRFSATLREHLKRSTKCSFNYFTSSSSYYSKQEGFLQFSSIPKMPKPQQNTTLTTQQLNNLRRWRAEFGQSVRQLTVRNKSTKDNPGTLPINCYSAKPVEPRPLDFECLVGMADETSTEVPLPPLYRKGSFVVIKPGYQPTTDLPQAPFYFGRCTEDVSHPQRKACINFYKQDLLLGLHFVDSHITTNVDLAGILKEVQNLSLVDDMIIIEDDDYFDFVTQSLYCDDRPTPNELAEEADKEEEDCRVTVRTTRSGRASRRPTGSSFFYYD